MADSREIQFQNDIIAAMEPLGWLRGMCTGYDRTRALYPEDVVGYFKDAWPERWEKFCKLNPGEPEAAFVDKVTQQLEKNGTLNVLRHGFKLPGVQVELCGFKPDHDMNPETLTRYRANRLRVVPEVSYSPHERKTGDKPYNPRLDLVLFINGIPVATLELKSEFKQSVENAKRQYMKDRPVLDPVTRKAEPLLAFKRGALVHFAVSQYEVAMTTKLDGMSTVFLPFNRGTDEGGAGNAMPKHEGEYATSYLWTELFTPDALLTVIGRYLHLQKKTVEKDDGERVTRESLIFPRYHQWQVVCKLLDSTRSEGAGKRYLIQHSAGSGKSNSIAWLAHQLSALYDAEGQKLFSSIIVVTDRTVLDSQLQNTIYQFEHAHGVVLPITKDVGNKSKSAQLGEALANQTRIIIVTIQTFPALFEALDKHPQLAKGRYAVIADEAHSSQTGRAAGKLKAVLATQGEDEERELSAEEVITATVEARGPNQAISYFAFTATPKSKTIELFGTRPDESRPPAPDNKPEPFHVYSMRQAIEEGFILNVLQNYTTYNTALKIAKAGETDVEVDSKRTRIKIGKWLRLHPYNIDQKVQVVVEHYRSNVRHLLEGQAKAMVVTASRREAVRWHLAMKAYCKENGYADVHPLVAFSGSLMPDDVIPQEVTERSPLLNENLHGRDLAEVFDTPGYNVMIAANKYQTGFDQPKLCAMYVDKKLKNVDCVQTLSRLNRTFPGKETFILDFFNEPQDILDAFIPYYNNAKLADVSDPQKIYEIQEKLDEEGIYHWEEVDAFALTFFDKKASASKLAYHCQPAKERFAARYRMAREELSQFKIRRQAAEKAGNTVEVKRLEYEQKQAAEELDRLELFRKNLQTFNRVYEFLSQIVEYDDAELEKLNVFAKHLYPLLRLDRLDEDSIDIAELHLTHYRLSKNYEGAIRIAESNGDGALNPASDVGTGKPHEAEKKRLSEIIQSLNDLFGAEINDEDQLQFLQGIAQRISRQDDVMDQVRNHTTEQIMHGLFPKRVSDAVLEALTDNEMLSQEVLGDERKAKHFARVVLKFLTTSTLNENR